MRPLYINGISCISPQPTFGGDFPFIAKEYDTARLLCIEPDYSPYIDPRASRRMGRLLKYGTAAGLQALRDAAVLVPDAISTGTGFGLLDDSGKFLKNVNEADEGVVSPTAFIQSTHNTVSSNIALTVGCTGHNNTFVHKGFSFESALLDAQMLMTEKGNVQNILTGSYEETTDYSFRIMQRLKLIRNTPCSNLDLLKHPGSGTLAGEGAAFFVLSREKNDKTYAMLAGADLVYRPQTAEVVRMKLDAFLARHQMALEDIDIVISGICGDGKRDDMAMHFNKYHFTDQSILGYKHMCGEYMTSSAFALWLGAMIAKTGKFPKESVLIDKQRSGANILIYNNYKYDHAFILLRKVS